MPRPSLQPIEAALKRLAPGMTVYIPGVSGECEALYAAFQRSAHYARGINFTGVHFPGINKNNYLGLHAEARQRAYFMQPGLRSGLQDGHVELMQLDYPGIYQDLSSLEIDVAFAQVTAPDEHGRCSLGLSYDFLPAVWKNASLRVGLVNPTLPKTTGSFSIYADDCDLLCDAEGDLLSFDAGTPTPAMRSHAALVASLVRDGDTLEFGIGKLQAAVLDALKTHRNLRVYSGMVSSPIAALLDSNVIHGKASVQVGVALGDAELYKRVARDDRFLFRPVNETHDARRIGAIPQFCAINSGIEVDLFGQVNADSLGGRQVAGVGGLPAFVSGAKLSAQGRSIIALTAATDDGKISRIVPNFAAPALSAIPRHDADYVVTEYGIASLKDASVTTRASRLIAIAAPQFREELTQAWSQLLKRL